jgi:hypothetical protein
MVRDRDLSNETNLTRVARGLLAKSKSIRGRNNRRRIDGATVRALGSLENRSRATYSNFRGIPARVELCLNSDSRAEPGRALGGYAIGRPFLPDSLEPWRVQARRDRFSRSSVFAPLDGDKVRIRPSRKRREPL